MLTQEIEAGTRRRRENCGNCIGNASILPMRFDYESVVAFYIAPHLSWVLPNGLKGPPGPMTGLHIWYHFRTHFPIWFFLGPPPAPTIPDTPLSDPVHVT